MKAANEEINFPREEEVCSIVVLYDGYRSRARAMSACDYLVKQFWPEVEVKFHWWRTDFLSDLTLAKVAAENVVVADFLIISSESGGELSPALESWFESWLDRRGEREGALVDLVSSPRSPGRELFLREIGRRGRFDYLTAIPDESGSALNSDLPAKRVSSVRDDVFGETRPPSHYGLNE